MKPTEILIKEHQLIEQVLDCLEKAAVRLKGGEDIDPDLFIEAAEFVEGYADDSHHRKEEDILFVALIEKNMPADTGPIAVMLHEHEEGRRFTAGFRSAAEQMKAGEGGSGAAMDVIRNVLDYVNLLRGHIHKENNVLFPIADRVLAGDAMQVVSREFERILAEDKKNGMLAKYEALTEKLNACLHAGCTEVS